MAKSKEFHLRRLFLIALASEEENWSGIARRWKVAEPTLQNVVSGKTKSERLKRKIEDYIDRRFNALGLYFASRLETQAAAQEYDAVMDSKFVQAFKQL